MLKIVRGGFLLNGVMQPKLLGRSSFKLGPIVSYHYAGRGEEFSLGDARRWIEHNQRLFGEHMVLRVFLETGDWGPCEDCMFGSEPRDQGFWNVDALKDGARETRVHVRGQKILEWFFKISHETGVAFELVIDATLKHTDGVKAGEVDHVIRQVGVLMGELTKTYPRALVIPNVRNEWNAHNKTGHSIDQVNAWAMRWERDMYWAGSQPIVCPGGGDMYTYKVGRPGSGKYAMGLIHPDRQPNGRDWWQLPSIKRLRDRSNGMPVGFNESMYYVEREDRDRAKRWYRNPRGWTTDWAHYKLFAERSIDAVDYFIFHDEKGIQSDVDWPRRETRLEAYFGDSSGVLPKPDPIPDPEPDPIPDPEPDTGGYDLGPILNLLKIFGIVIPISVITKGINSILEELQNRGDQLDRIERDVGAILHAGTQGTDPVPIPEPEPEPDPEIEDEPPAVDERDYIPFDKREEWHDRVFYAYNVWRGHRDLSFIKSTVALHMTGVSRDELNEIIDDMADAHEKQKRLQWRIFNEEHRSIPGRMQVRKSVANAMRDTMQAWTDKYNELGDGFPSVDGCDSIRCKIKKLGI